MADIPTSRANEPASQANQPLSAPIGPVPITVLTQYLKDLSFESPSAPGILSQLGQNAQPNVAVNVNLATGQLSSPNADAPGPYECTLTIKAEGTLAQGEASMPAFIIECSYAGLFVFPANLPEGAIRALLMVEAPRLLFPFARQQISCAAQSGGFGPLLINPIDFGALYNQQMQYEAQAAQQQSGTA